LSEIPEFDLCNSTFRGFFYKTPHPEWDCLAAVPARALIRATARIRMSCIVVSEDRAGRKCHGSIGVFIALHNCLLSRETVCRLGSAHGCRKWKP
jgi:hypothetical protein